MYVVVVKNAIVRMMQNAENTTDIVSVLQDLREHFVKLVCNLK